MTLRLSRLGDRETLVGEEAEQVLLALAPELVEALRVDARDRRRRRPAPRRGSSRRAAGRRGSTSCGWPWIATMRCATRIPAERYAAEQDLRQQRREHAAEAVLARDLRTRRRRTRRTCALGSTTHRASPARRDARCHAPSKRGLAALGDAHAPRRRRRGTRGTPRRSPKRRSAATAGQSSAALRRRWPARIARLIRAASRARAAPSHAPTTTSMHREADAHRAVARAERDARAEPRARDDADHQERRDPPVDVAEQRVRDRAGHRQDGDGDQATCRSRA